MNTWIGFVPISIPFPHEEVDTINMEANDYFEGIASLARLIQVY